MEVLSHPHLIREVVTVSNKVRAQRMGAVLRSFRLLVCAHEKTHSFLQQGWGAKLVQQGCQ